MVNKFVILCYNPQFVNPVDFTELIKQLMMNGITTYQLKHLQDKALPFYIMSSETILTGVTKK
jgi:hypothetical protein